MIPKTVKINRRIYTIVQDERHTNGKGEEPWGEIAFEKNSIYLYDRQSDENKRITLLHEIVHGILYFMGRGELQNDEGFITALSENLYQVIKDNPVLFSGGIIHDFDRQELSE